MSLYHDYLYDLGLEIKLRALEARRMRDSTANPAERDCQSARLLAFNEVISIMQQQAIGLGIPLSDLQLEDIEPDRDLI